MRDAAGELGQRLHPLRLQQRLPCLVERLRALLHAAIHFGIGTAQLPLGAFAHAASDGERQARNREAGEEHDEQRQHVARVAAHEQKCDRHRSPEREAGDEDRDGREPGPQANG